MGSLMKNAVFFTIALVASTSFAKLNEVGDKAIIKNDRQLAELLETKCLEKLLVESGSTKRMLLLGYKLTSIQLVVQENHFIGKHVLVDVNFTKPDDVEGNLSYGNEFRCNLDLSAPVYLRIQ